MSILKSSLNSAIINIVAGIIITIIRLFASFFLARLLDPEDFGIVGMGAMVIGFIGHLAAAGVPSGVISKKKLSQQDVSTAFILVSIVRIILFFCIYLSAPIIANFFRESRLELVLKVMSFAFLFSLIGTIPNSLLRRDFRFLVLNVVNVFSVLFESLLAVFLAFATSLKYWCLIIPSVALNILQHLVLVFIVKWKPTLTFSKKSWLYFKPYFFYGSGASVSSYFLGNIDYILIGRMLGAKNLGFYEFAYRIPNLFCDRFLMPIQSVLVPMYSTLFSQSGMISLRSSFILVTRLILFISAPFFFLLFFFAEHFVVILWGEKWHSIVPLLKIFCISALVTSFLSPIDQFFFALNRPRLVFYHRLSRLIFTSFFLFLGIYYAKLKGAAFAILFGWLPGFYFLNICFRLLGVTFKEFLCVIKPIFFALLSIIPLLCFEIFFSNFSVKIFFQFLCYFLSYFLMIRIFDKDLFYFLMSIFNKYFGRFKRDGGF